MTVYFDNLCTAMELLSQHERTVFIGQAVKYPGTAMHNTLKSVPMDRRLEFPVMENTQLGFCTGMSLNGFIPICIFPRINFLLEAISQLVSHLDKLPLYSDYRPHVIVRTAIATDKPLDPGCQHLGNFISPISQMLKTVQVVELTRAEQVVPVYQYALAEPGGWLIVEHLEMYN